MEKYLEGEKIEATAYKQSQLKLHRVISMTAERSLGGGKVYWKTVAEEGDSSVEF